MPAPLISVYMSCWTFRFSAVDGGDPLGIAAPGGRAKPGSSLKAIASLCTPPGASERGARAALDSCTGRDWPACSAKCRASLNGIWLILRDHTGRLGEPSNVPACTACPTALHATFA